MTHQLLNTLYVQMPDAYLHLEADTLRVEVDKECIRQIPLHHLGAVVLFGNAMISPHAMHRCVSEGREVTFLDQFGRFRCRVEGPAHGNILLRLAQFGAAQDDARTKEIARRIVAAKIRNSRGVLLRGARDAGNDETRLALSQAAERLAETLEALPAAGTLDEMRGYEGIAATNYFGAFGRLITSPTAEFSFTLRTRRPPRDRVNTLLSFLYSLVTHDCAGAVQGVGLDPQLGYLHAVRSGRPALALDLTEEFRAGFADRLALTLINRHQLRPDQFTVREEAGGSVTLNEEGRKAVLVAYQKRKEELINHHFLQEEVPIGLLPHLQARLLARHLRGELEHYEPYLWS